eukprot:15475101-Alexandrium_andersonii.AAC.1
MHSGSGTPRSGAAIRPGRSRTFRTAPQRSARRLPEWSRSLLLPARRGRHRSLEGGSSPEFGK